MILTTKNHRTLSLVALVAAALLTLAVGCDNSEQPGAQQDESQPSPSAGAADQAEKPGAQEPGPSAAQKQAERRAQQQAQQRAQQAEKPQQPVPGGEAGQQVSDEALNNYVEVRPKVQVIQNDLQKKMNSVQQPSEAKELQQEARQRISKELADAGLSSQDYIKIETRMRQDPEFRSQLEAKMETPN